MKVVSESLINPVPGPVMNSLVSDTKVICNDSIPNPITPVPIPVKLPIADNTKSITVLNGTHRKVNKGKINGKLDDNVKGKEKDAQKDEVKDESLIMDNSNESSMSPSEPMDCNSTPNISPAHLPKCNSSNEDVAMSETSVCFKVKICFVFFFKILFQSSSAGMQVETTENNQQMQVEPSELNK